MRHSFLIIVLLLLISSSNNSIAQTPCYADIHLHSAVKPFNSRHHQNYSLWDDIEHDCGTEYSSFFINGSKELPKVSQSNFAAMARGNLRLGCLSLVPIEHNMRTPRLVKYNEKGFSTMSCLTGIRAGLDFVESPSIDYYEDLIQNIEYLKAAEGIPYYIRSEAYNFKVLTKGEEVAPIIDNPNMLGILLTIEGAHVLGNSGMMKYGETEKPEYEKLVLNNVERLKGNLPMRDGGEYIPYPILFMGLNHFFWNGLSGQAKVFFGKQTFIFGKQKGLKEGVTPLGEKVIKRLLAKDGRRIIIDTKHMNVKSRQWYYNYLKEQREKGDTIPVVASHVGVSGKSWEEHSYSKKDSKGKNKKESLSHYSMHMSIEDIKEIHLTKGLMGIMLDKYRIMGDKTTKRFKKTVPGSTQRRQILIEVLLANMLTVVETIDDATGWDIICMGSDFDGLIQAFDTYVTAEDYPRLAKDLEDFLANPKPVLDLYSVKEVKCYMYDLTAKEIVHKVMLDNVKRFAERNL